MNPALIRFRNEVVNFSLVSFLNLVFAALAIAYGIAYLIIALAGHPLYPDNPGFRILSGAAAMISFGLGLGWLLTATRIFRGIRTIRAQLRESEEPLPDDRATCLMVRMLAHYRDNRTTVRVMIAVSTAGGCFFFVLGILTALRAVSLTGSGGSMTMDAAMVIPAMLLTLGIAGASLLSSWYFSRFARVWDRRIREIDRSECTLQEKLGPDGS